MSDQNTPTAGELLREWKILSKVLRKCDRCGELNDMDCLQNYSCRQCKEYLNDENSEEVIEGCERRSEISRALDKMAADAGITTVGERVAFLWDGIYSFAPAVEGHIKDVVLNISMQDLKDLLEWLLIRPK